MEVKNEGKDIPNTEKNNIDLSKNVSLYKAVVIPNNKPIIIKNYRTKCKTIVSGNVSEITELTVFPLFTNDSLK